MGKTGIFDLTPPSASRLLQTCSDEHTIFQPQLLGGTASPCTCLSSPGPPAAASPSLGTPSRANSSSSRTKIRLPKPRSRRRLSARRRRRGAGRKRRSKRPSRRRPAGSSASRGPAGAARRPEGPERARMPLGEAGSAPRARGREAGRAPAPAAGTRAAARGAPDASPGPRTPHKGPRSAARSFLTCARRPTLGSRRAAGRNAAPRRGTTTRGGLTGGDRSGSAARASGFGSPSEPRPLAGPRPRLARSPDVPSSGARKPALPPRPRPLASAPGPPRPRKSFGVFWAARASSRLCRAAGDGARRLSGSRRGDVGLTSQRRVCRAQGPAAAGAGVGRSRRGRGAAFGRGHDGQCRGVVPHGKRPRSLHRAH